MKSKNKFNIDELIGISYIAICIDNCTVENRLSIGKEYEITEITKNTYRVKTDKDRYQLFGSGFFKKKGR